jgi:uroporphyrinogen-III synthase
MSVKSYFVKMVVKITPKFLILWVVNKKLKGVAELTDLEINFDERRIYTQMILAGEQESAEVLLEDICVVKNGDSSMLVVRHVKSNKVWINTLLTRVIAGREVKIPDSQVELVCELFVSEQIE